jgi:FlaG/FlaF family flagellin (archaellin)
MLKALLIVLAALIPSLAAGQSVRVSDDYAIAALRAVIHAQTFGTLSENSAKEWEFIDEADVQATTEAEQQSLEHIKKVLLGGWSVNHSGTQLQACYAALKTALKKRDGATPESCK